MRYTENAIDEDILTPQRPHSILARNLFIQIQPYMYMYNINLWQVETLGDAVSMVASGLTDSKERHADGLALIAFDLVRQTHNVSRMPVIRQSDVTLNLKIGIQAALCLVEQMWVVLCISFLFMINMYGIFS